jgi:hypothetical protein
MQQRAAFSLLLSALIVVVALSAGDLLAPSEPARSPPVPGPEVHLLPASAPASPPGPMSALVGEPANASAMGEALGPCPADVASPVVRSGLDADGWPTWWHADGSKTKRVLQHVGGAGVPAIVRMQPAGDRVRRAD